MKNILTLVLILLCLLSQAQVTPSNCVKTKNSTTAFGSGVAKGTIITDTATGKVYSVKATEGLEAIKTIATCSITATSVPGDLTELTNPPAPEIVRPIFYQSVGTTELQGSTNYAAWEDCQSLTMTPKGDQLHITFSAPFISTAANHRMLFAIFVNNVQIPGSYYRFDIGTGTLPIFIQRVLTSSDGITFGSSTKVEIRWQGSSNCYQFGTLNSSWGSGPRILTAQPGYALSY